MHFYHRRADVCNLQGKKNVIACQSKVFYQLCCFWLQMLSASTLMANEKGNLHSVIITVAIKATFLHPRLVLLLPLLLFRLLQLFPKNIKGPALTQCQSSADDEFLIRSLMIWTVTVAENSKCFITRQCWSGRSAHSLPSHIWQKLRVTQAARVHVCVFSLIMG